MAGSIPLPPAYSSYNPGIIYKLDEQNLYTQYGIVVEATQGIMDVPQRKSPMRHEWPDSHGEDIDLATTYYEAKDITLQCWLMATTKLELSEKLNTFLQSATTPGLHRLYIEVDTAKPLIYQVYVSGKIVVKKNWFKGYYYADFQIQLREPEPMKKVLRYNATPLSFSITITTAKPVNIFWGDNTAMYDVTGTSRVITKSYGSSGLKFIVITGDIDAITGLTTVATVIWDKLL